MIVQAFKPTTLLKSATVQTLLASLSLRKLICRNGRAFRKASRQFLMDADHGKLQLSYTPAGENSRALIVFLHGWEGSMESTYLFSACCAFWNAGFDCVRINFRDHGDSHHLNEELFHSCRLQEVASTVSKVIEKFPHRHHFLAGFSLGGNFALRTAIKATSMGMPLDHVFAVCPVIDPANTLETIEHGNPLFHRYFLKKWVSSMRIKENHFPHLYDFGHLSENDGLLRLTDELITQHSPYPTSLDYFRAYSVAGDRLSYLKIPTTILMAEDDPIIPLADYDNLPDNPMLDLHIQPHGGHCGFIENFRLHGWADKTMIKIAETYLE